MRILQDHFAPRLCVGISGLFFTMPGWWQRRRIRELARTLSLEDVSVLVRRPRQDCASIVEACQ